MLNPYDYPFETIQKDKIIRIYSNNTQENRYTNVCHILKNYIFKVAISSETTFIKIGLVLQDRLFDQVTNLRLFDSEGVEIFEDELGFLKDNQILYATNNNEDFNPMQSFSAFEIQQVLGEGGFGKVMLGINRFDKQKVAIKLIDTVKIGNAQDIEMVFREAETLKSLKHKNIVKIYNSYTLPNMKVVFIMEYCSGGELLEYLEEFIEKGPLDENEAKLIFSQIADAIGFCHSMNVIHRDLKLENILFAGPQKTQIKIIDFGIAGITNNLNVDKINAGSLGYMPPEVLSGRIKKVNSQIDIWAMGIILYAMISGSLPFYGQNPSEVLEQISKVTPNSFSHQQFQLNLNCSVELKDLLSLIFIQDPAKRIKLINILHHSWLGRFNEEYPKATNQPHQRQKKNSTTLKIVREITKITQPPKTMKQTTFLGGVMMKQQQPVANLNYFLKDADIEEEMEIKTSKNILNQTSQRSNTKSKNDDLINKNYNEILIKFKKIIKEEREKNNYKLAPILNMFRFKNRNEDQLWAHFYNQRLKTQEHKLPSLNLNSSSFERSKVMSLSPTYLDGDGKQSPMLQTQSMFRSQNNSPDKNVHVKIKNEKLSIKQFNSTVRPNQSNLQINRTMKKNKFQIKL